ncbi:MAG: hypothetical protein GY822_05505 [Deltaproteobacteria bacterium]|nr:hypothetical protein [Deltaproteobacteria bacterium]
MKKSIFPLRSALLTLAASLTLTACVPKSNLVIEEAVNSYEGFFAAACKEPEEKPQLLVGRLDVSNPSVNAGYTALLRVSLNDEVNGESVYAKEAHVYFTDASGEQIDGVDIPGPADTPNVFSIGGVVDEQEVVVVAPLLTATDVTMLGPRVQNATVRVLANVKIWGALESGYPVDSPIFTLPIDVCRGCLYNTGVTEATLLLADDQKTCLDESNTYAVNDGVVNGCSFPNQEGLQRYCQ